MSSWVKVVKSWIAPGKSEIRQYPNPWRKDRHTGLPIVFENLKGKTTIKIFTHSGELVRTLPIADSTAKWDLTTETGDHVGTGIYQYEMKSEDGEIVTGDVVVHRPLLVGTHLRPPRI